MDYLIKDFTDTNNIKLQTVHIGMHRGKDSLWEELDKAKKDGRKISVYQLTCVLDWS